jgi:hypothetical protein
MTERLRHLCINGDRYGWRVSQQPDGSAAGTTVKFMAFRHGTHGAALRLAFGQSGSGHMGQHGMVMLDGSGIVLNLHQPKVATQLIQLARQAGWSANTAFEASDGHALLATLPPSALQALAAPTPPRPDAPTATHQLKAPP